MEKKNLDWGNLGFGYMTTDYRYVANYKDGKWDDGALVTDPTVTLNECAGVFQYSQSCFEGLKAYTTEDGHIVCFRPDLNASRMKDSCERLEMPVFPDPVLFIALGLVFIIAGKNISKNIGEENIEEEVQQAETEAEEIRKPENVVSLLQVDPIELEFGYGIIPLADVNQGGDLLDRVVMIRRQIALELGTVVPIIRLRDNIQLNPNQYIIKIKGVQVTEGEILFDHYMAMNPGYVEEEITGIPTFEPSFHLPAIWITGSAERTCRESWIHRS